MAGSLSGTAVLAAGVALAAQGCLPPPAGQHASQPAAGGPAAVARASVRTETKRLMGVPWTITVHADSPGRAAGGIAAAFAEVARLESILSDYDAGSELSRLSAAAPTAAPQPVGDDLWRVLARAAEIRDATAGAFDPTVGPLTTLWRRARRTGRMPSADRLAAARAAVGPDALVLAAEGHAVSLRRPGMRLDLGGIGMGYAVDRAMDELRRRGIASAMVDASGDIAVSDAPPGSAGWRIAMAPFGRASGEAGGDPAESASLLLENRAVTTSGDAFQGVEIAGVRYSHIVDPRTGVGVVGPAAVTVIAPDCTTADALATAASVLGPERGLEAVAAQPGCLARFFWREDSGVRQARSPGWPAAYTPAQETPAGVHEGPHPPQTLHPDGATARP